MKCRNCQGTTEPILKMGRVAMNFCRRCKLPHDESGNPMIISTDLKSDFNPLKKARDTIRTAHPTMAPGGKTALEVSLVQAFQEMYFSGLKDGVMLAYSQDYQEGQPHEGTGKSL